MANNGLTTRQTALSLLNGLDDSFLLHRDLILQGRGSVEENTLFSQFAEAIMESVIALWCGKFSLKQLTLLIEAKSNYFHHLFGSESGR